MACSSWQRWPSRRSLCGTGSSRPRAAAPGNGWSCSRRGGTAHCEVCHGPVLSHARNVAGSRRAPINGLNVARKSLGNQTLWTPYPPPLSGCSKETRWVKACRAAGTVQRVGAGDDFRGGRKRAAGPGAGAAGQRDGGRPRPAVEDSRGVCRTGHAVFIAAFIGTIFIGMVIPIFTIQDYIK